MHRLSQRSKVTKTSACPCRQWPLCTSEWCMNSIGRGVPSSYQVEMRLKEHPVIYNLYRQMAVILTECSTQGFDLLVLYTRHSHIASHLFAELSICSLCASPLLTWVVTRHLDDRQRHQEVSYDFSESVSDLLWSFGIFQVFICDEAVGRGGLEQEVKLDRQISLWSCIVFLQRFIDKEDDFMTS